MFKLVEEQWRIVSNNHFFVARCLYGTTEPALCAKLVEKQWRIVSNNHFFVAQCLFDTRSS